MDIAQLRIRIWNKVKDFDLMKSIMADVEEYIKSRNDGKPLLGGPKAEQFCTCSQGKGLDTDADGLLYCIDCGLNVQEQNCT